MKQSHLIAIALKHDLFVQSFRMVNDSKHENLCGEGKTRNEFAEWHVAWLAE